MKQHITAEDLAELTDGQRQNLLYLWRPQQYDLVVANICTDVEAEEYQQVEFVIGEVMVQESHHGCNILVRDLKTMDNVYDETEAEVDLDQAALSEVCPGFEIYSKDDCWPLLNIGQIIELLQRSGYGSVSFYLIVPTSDSEITCGVGRDNCGIDYEAPELCDTLWESLKALL